MEKYYAERVNMTSTIYGEEVYMAEPYVKKLAIFYMVAGFVLAQIILY